MNKKPAKFSITVPKGYRRKKLPYFQEWINALENGSFRQVTGTLCAPKGSKSVGYCCLGVLSRVQGRLTADKREDRWYDQSSTNKTKYDRSYCDLVKDNPAYKALRNNGRFPTGVSVIMTNDDVIKSLVGCNDDGKLSFKEIAQVIRRIWKA